MIGSKKIACVIPARLASSRFPRKMLQLLKGKPLIEWVYRRAKTVPLFDELVIATDSKEIQTVAASFGARALLTSPDCPSGTDRLVELQVQGILSADIWVNWQGDEPFVHADLIHDLLQTASNDTADIWTLKKKILDPHEITSPHTPKVVCDEQGYALYFSRSTIPFNLSASSPTYFKHIGMYAFKNATLQKLKNLKPCELERTENLEQLRFLFAGMRIRVHETSHSVLGIDLPEHLAQAEKLATESLYRELFA